MNVKLHIERLVLDGVNIAPHQHHLLQASLTTELTRLLNNGRLASNLVEGAALPRLSTSGIQLTGSKPEANGRANRTIDLWRNR